MRDERLDSVQQLMIVVAQLSMAEQQQLRRVAANAVGGACASALGGVKGRERVSAAAGCILVCSPFLIDRRQIRLVLSDGTGRKDHWVATGCMSEISLLRGFIRRHPTSTKRMKGRGGESRGSSRGSIPCQVNDAMECDVCSYLPLRVSLESSHCSVSALVWLVSQLPAAAEAAAATLSRCTLFRPCDTSLP